MRQNDSRGMSRRDFCVLGAMAAAAAWLPADVLASPAGTTAKTATSADKYLAFFNTHTRESLGTLYCCDGRYDAEALARVNYLLRDHRADEVRPIDVKLLDLLYSLNNNLQTGEPYHVISGYRSPHTNRMLRARGGATTGVASRSLHMVGKAIDIRVPGVLLKDLHKAAVALKKGGVGIYPASDFVHVDTGRVRYWSGR